MSKYKWKKKGKGTNPIFKLSLSFYFKVYFDENIETLTLAYKSMPQSKGRFLGQRGPIQVLFYRWPFVEVSFRIMIVTPGNPLAKGYGSLSQKRSETTKKCSVFKKRLFQKARGFSQKLKSNPFKVLVGLVNLFTTSL